MTKPIKFTKNETKEINDLRIEVSEIFTQLGQITLEKKKRLKELEETEEKLTIRHGELEVTEQTLFKQLNTKYGNGSYNPETGEFTPEEVETTPKQ
jgi:predicted transcriptional regulator